MKIAIIAERFLIYPEMTIEVGGVQVWLSELVEVLKDLKHEVLVIQKSKENFCINFRSIEVRGIKYDSECGFGNDFIKDCKYNIGAHKVVDDWDAQKIVYANSLVAFPVYRAGNIFLQHGIYWDGGSVSPRKYLEYIVRFLGQPQSVINTRDIWLYKKSQLTISVDTNFINYARAILKDRFQPSKLVYIPNFSKISEREVWEYKWSDPEYIIFLFARRFTLYRGVVLWADVVETLLKETKNTKFIFDGKGAYEQYLFNRFGDNPRVKIRAVDPSGMWKEYAKSHVVVVPTTYSEGTSLACIEGMANGCIPLVTDVGGLANLVIPDYNGYIVRPLYEDLLKSSLRIIESNVARIEKVNRSYNMAKFSFSVEIWRQRLRDSLVTIL